MSASPASLTDLDKEIRRIVYDGFISYGQALSKSDIAARLNVPEDEVTGSLSRLAEAHMLVLQPSSGQVLMANPFSAVPTAFRVASEKGSWWGNCIWDGLGVIAMTGGQGRLETSCPDCGEALSLEVSAGRLGASEGIVHFAVPASKWWDDIVFT
jgi:hypothetical protein